MDISIGVDNIDAVYTEDYYEPVFNYFNEHSLSRTFCNFICRSNAVQGEPELDQIGRITNIDIAPIHAMETYGSDNGEELAFFLEVAESEEERQKILNEARQAKAALIGNIDIVIATIDALILKLLTLPNLHNMLNDNGRDTLGYEYYFTDFNLDKGDGYIGNNFGQDLRNFKRFLEYAKTKGTTTVYFMYG